MSTSRKTEPLISPSSKRSERKSFTQIESKDSLLPRQTKSDEPNSDDVIVDLSETTLSQAFDAYESDNEANNSEKVSKIQKCAQYVYRCQQAVGFNGIFFDGIDTKFQSYVSPGLNALTVSGFDYINTHVLSHMLKQAKPVSHIKKVDHTVHILTSLATGAIVALAIGLSDYKSQWCHNLSVCTDPAASNLAWGPSGLAIKSLIAWRLIGTNNPNPAKTKNLSYPQRFFNEVMRVPNAFATQKVILGLLDSFMIAAPMNDFGFKFVMITGADIYQQAFRYLAFTPTPFKILADQDQIENQVPVERLTVASHIPQTDLARESKDSTVNYPSYTASIAYALGKEIFYKGAAMLSTYGIMYAAEGQISPHMQQSVSLGTYIVLDNLIQKTKPIAKCLVDCGSAMWANLPCVRKSRRNPLLKLTPGKASLNSI